MLEFRPDVLNPPAIVVQAFDEARALEEIKAAVERRDEAKGEFKGAVLVIGQTLIEARRAMPGTALPNGMEKYSPAFLAFIEKCGLARITAIGYMGFARNPARYTAKVAGGKALKKALRAARGADYYPRRRILAEVSALLAEAPDLETARRVITEELNELAS